MRKDRCNLMFDHLTMVIYKVKVLTILNCIAMSSHSSDSDRIRSLNKSVIGIFSLL